MSLLLFRRNTPDPQRPRRVSGALKKSQTIIEFRPDAVKRVDSQTARQSNQLETASRSLRNIITLVEDLAMQARLLSLNATPGEAGTALAVIATEAGDLAKEIAKANQRIGNEIVNVQSLIDNLALSGMTEDRAQTVMIVDKNIASIVSSIETLSNAVQSARTAALSLAGDGFKSRSYDE